MLFIITAKAEYTMKILLLEREEKEIKIRKEGWV